MYTVLKSCFIVDSALEVACSTDKAIKFFVITLHYSETVETCCNPPARSIQKSVDQRNQNWKLQTADSYI